MIYKNNLFHLTHLGIIQISGSDAEKFLQGQLTCNVHEVDAMQSRLGAHCDPKGRIQATFRLFKQADSYYFLLPKNMVQHLMLRLQKYAPFFKVALEDISQHWQAMGWYDSNNDPDLKTIYSCTPTEIDAVAQLDQVSLLRIPDLKSRFIFVGPNKFIENIQQILNTIPKTLAVTVWDLFDIWAGIPSIYPETCGQFTPHQLNYHLINGISFDKGCYTGQEIVARMQYLGKLKQQMRRIHFTYEQLPIPNTKIYNASGQEVGSIIMVAAETITKAQALAVLPAALAENVYLNHPNGPILMLEKLPYLS